MVGSLWGTDSYFRSSNGSGFSGTESHFGTGGDGTILQWQDTEYQADAQLQGNDDCISIETADHGDEFPSWSGSDVPAWTPEQFEAQAYLVAWLCETHDIPCELITDTEDSTRGIGYHRQGIDPYRTHGEKYSNSYGKICPGNKRVAQIPALIARAKKILDGEDMPLNSDDLNSIADRVAAVLRQHDEHVVADYNGEPLTREGALALARFAGVNTNTLKYAVLPQLALILSAVNGQSVDVAAAVTAAIETALSNVEVDADTQAIVSLLVPAISDAVNSELQKLTLDVSE